MTSGREVKRDSNKTNKLKACNQYSQYIYQWRNVQSNMSNIFVSHYQVSLQILFSCFSLSVTAWQILHVYRFRTYMIDFCCFQLVTHTQDTN